MFLYDSPVNVFARGTHVNETMRIIFKNIKVRTILGFAAINIKFYFDKLFGISHFHDAYG
jgi:hypothetical protein